MKVIDIIIESTQEKITKRQVQSTTGLNTYSDSERADSTYTAYRLGMAVAGSNGKDPIKMKAKSWIGKKKSTHPYTKAEQDMLKQAYKAVGANYKDLNQGDLKSYELDTVYKESPVAKPKRNKYGV
jgi:C4-dicarboxylate-specific signal transduction histidine kinase